MLSLKERKFRQHNTKTKVVLHVNQTKQGAKSQRKEEMTNLMKIEQNLTMTSREIAELTGKSHNHVMRDIRAMMEELEGNPNLDSVCKSTTYNGSNGQSYNQYELDKDTCLTLLLGYDAAAVLVIEFIRSKYARRISSKLLDGT